MDDVVDFSLIGIEIITADDDYPGYRISVKSNDNTIITPMPKKDGCYRYVIHL